ncbi:MAG: glycosyltransferase family 2 protein [Myxococcales bacterium]|nr:glycosyltransferase family 2 protein [Myxococcales bacterium]
METERPARPLVSVSIVNYNGLRFLKGVIPRVYAQTHQPVELIIVDNASKDGSKEWIRANYPEITLIENERNEYFARGHNLGIRASKGEYVLILNQDLYLTDTYIERIVDAMEADPTVGGADGKLIRLENLDDPVELNTRGKTLDSAGLENDIFFQGQVRGFGRVDEGQFDEQTYVFGALGAAAVFRRAFLDDVAFEGQYLDELFAMYVEDFDIAWRGQLLGWKTLYVPTAVGYHLRGLKDRKHAHDPFERLLLRLVNRNRLIVVLKNATGLQLFVMAPIFALHEMAKAVVLLARTPFMLRAYFGVIKHLPSTIRKRWEIQRRRRVTSTHMLGLHVLPQTLVELRELRRRRRHFGA